MDHPQDFDPFDYQRVVMDACDRLGIRYDRRSRGTLLVPRSGVEVVLRDVIAAGYIVLGLEGFELDGPYIRPRMDLIYDSDRTPTAVFDVLAQFDDDVWVDIVLDPPRDIRRR
jgi:hypothetical protein